MVWLIEGCFDGDGTKPFSKLIKPNAKYTFGRKEPADIVIKSKLISQEGGYLKTGPFTIDDVADVHSRPSIEITAGKKGVRIVPAKEVHKWEANLDGYVGIIINVGGKRSLEDGDLIIFASKLPLSLRWAPFAFSIPRDRKIEPEWVPMCAATGIHLAAGKNILPGCNFYMIEKAGLTLNVLTALATAMSIVTSSFLQRFLGTASLPRLDEESLEREFNELDPYDFQPPLGDDLIQPDALGDDADHSTVLVADHRRPHLLQGVSLLFVRTGTGETPHQSLLAERVGAKTSVIEPDTPEFSSDRALTRFISDHAQTAQTHLEAVKSQSTWITHESGLVILVEGTAAVGDTEWFLRLRRVALSLRIAMPLDGATCVTRTILRSSVKQILFRPPLDPLEGASHLESVPRTDEPATQAPAPEPQLETEAESESVEAAKASPTLAKNPLLEPLQSEALAPADTTKRPLKRRAGQGLSASSALDDLLNSNTGARRVNATQSKAAVSHAGAEATAPAQSTEHLAIAAPSSRLKRRAATARTSDVWDMAFGGSKGAPMGASVGAADSGGSFANGSLAANTQGELKSKRFRMHLNETDARETEQQDLRLREADTQRAGQSAFSQSPQTQDAEPARRRRSRPPDSSSQGAVESLQDAAAEPSDTQDGGASNDAQRRKRPTNDVERARVGASSEARGTSASDAQSFFIREKSGKAGIAPGQKPDRDEVFLQALSTGSRTKFDKFDEEFNKLRIARPQYAGGSLATTHFVNQEEADDQMFEAFKLARAEELDDLFSVSHGNFVAVDFVPLIKRREQRPASTAFDGRPNFKKFKQAERPKRVPIALEHASGPGEMFGDPAVRNASATRSHDTTQDLAVTATPEAGMFAATTGASARPRTKKKSLFADPSESEEEEEAKPIGSRRHAAASSRPKQVSDVPSRGRRNKALAALYEDVEDLEDIDESPGADEDAASPEPDLRLDDDWELDGADGSNASMRPQGGLASSRSAAPSKSHHRRGGDDSDGDSVTFGGFKRTRRAPSSTAPSKRARR